MRSTMPPAANLAFAGSHGGWRLGHSPFLRVHFARRRFTRLTHFAEYFSRMLELNRRVAHLSKRAGVLGACEFKNSREPIEKTSLYHHVGRMRAGDQTLRHESFHGYAMFSLPRGYQHSCQESSRFASCEAMALGNCLDPC
jgi:hypothetical protein